MFCCNLYKTSVIAYYTHGCTANIITLTEYLQRYPDIKGKRCPNPRGRLIREYTPWDGPGYDIIDWDFIRADTEYAILGLGEGIERRIPIVYKD